MDWLEEVLFEGRNRLKKTSLKWSMALYMLLTLLGVFVVGSVTTIICDRWIALISSLHLQHIPGIDVKISSYMNADLLMGGEKILYLAFYFIRSWCVLLYSGAGMLIGSFLFYRNKLELPLETLLNGAKSIGDKKLDISCCFDSGDEMGQVCNAFDDMRLKLIENREEIWNLCEEQRRVNQVFAHDLRTPLTVVKGYVEFMNQYYKTGKLTPEQIEGNLQLLQEQLNRVMEFVKTMKQLTSLEEIEGQAKKISGEELQKKVEEICHILNRKDTLVEFRSEEIGEEIFADVNIILEVLENLLSNSLRFAGSKVQVSTECIGDLLYLYVQDDGGGFSKEDLKAAAKAYYTGNGQDTEGTHFGLGLYISSILCKKHGGVLEIGNSLEGGAFITASFLIT